MDKDKIAKELMAIKWAIISRGASFIEGWQKDMEWFRGFVERHGLSPNSLGTDDLETIKTLISGTQELYGAIDKVCDLIGDLAGKYKKEARQDLGLPPKENGE